jgi:hypothetical protein
MPWTVGDVDAHKKGLTSKQKKQWVEVANSVLSRCMTDGGTDATCAPKAIRQANGVAGNQLHVNVSNNDYVIREEMHQGREHIVVPVVMMVEGVHNGSMGPLLHPADELGKFPESWNGIPVVINHPIDNEGNNVSANSPEILDSDVAVGKVFHTQMENNKLKSEAYLDKEKLTAISPVALAAIMNGEPLEVSIGVFTEEDKTPGTWNNENYTAVAINHRPDHLALLPGGTGACSWNDGCGVRVNEEGGKNKMNNNSEDVIKLKDAAVQRILEANMDMGFSTALESARRVVDSLDNENATHYLEDMNDTSIVYTKRDRNNNAHDMYQQAYELDEAGNPRLVGNPQKVSKKISYVPVSVHVERTKFNNNVKGGNTMANNENCGQCMEKVIAIINSNATHFTAADREWLLTQDETLLDKLMPKAPEVNSVPAINSVPVELTSEQVLKAMSAEDKAALSYGKKQLAARKAEMIKGIQDNTSKELWPDAVLSTLSEEFLEKLHASVVDANEQVDEVINYALNGNARRFETNSTLNDNVMYPVGVEIDFTK